MHAVELVIFDMAGTTVRDDDQVPRAFAAALAAHGIDVSAERIREIRGASKRQAIADLLPPDKGRAARAAQVYATFRERLAAEFAGTAREVPGAAGVFAWMHARAIRVALNTGFDRDTAHMLVDALGWREGVFDALVCGDEVAHGRPAPDLIQHCMQATGIVSAAAVASIGDTVLDLRAGFAAGVRLNIGVLSGAHSRALLEHEPHTHLIASVADLPQILA